MSFEIFIEEDRQRERAFLATYDLDINFFNKLGVKLKQIVPERNCYRIETDKGFYCLKKMCGSFQDVYLMQEMTIHLKKHGFDNVSNIIRQPDGGILVPYMDSEYYLTQWVDGRESDYLNLSDIKEAAEALASFHQAAEGFTTKLNTHNRRLYGRWESGFCQKLGEIEEAQGLVMKEISDKETCRIINEYIESSEKDTARAISILEKSGYDKLCARDEKLQGFIHHDYGLYNIMHTFQGETYIGGLENAVFDIRMHDLGHLIFKLMRRRGWELETAMDIISWYNDLYKLQKEDYQVLTAYLTLPHDFRQLQKLYSAEDRDLEDLEELDRININSEYSMAKRQFLREMEKNADLKI